ncbi:hypothetical protein QBC45DRAFT_170043 [Copromyces sp. CBS 386.78]|nr:hypothetical protein QBC45DRAFT_170043 [Copromyces sp. CBS 386.78]
MPVSSDVYRYFGFSCPRAGNFYICSDSPVEFFGCCSIDPCTEAAGGFCPDDKVEYASFSADKWYEIPGQQCFRPNEGVWWACRQINTPFLGCCTTNPCAEEGCPLENIRPAILSNQTYEHDQILYPKGSGIVPQPSETRAGDGGDGGLSKGAIAGIAVGAVIAALIIFAGIMWKCGWLPGKKKDDGNQEAEAPQGWGYMDETGHGFDPTYGYSGYHNNGLGLGTVSEVPVSESAHELPAGNYPSIEMDAGPGAVPTPQGENKQQHNLQQGNQKQDGQPKTISTAKRERID